MRASNNLGKLNLLLAIAATDRRRESCSWLPLAGLAAGSWAIIIALLVAII